MEYPPAPYPPYIQDSGDAAPMMPVDTPLASTVANDREAQPCGGPPVDADRTLLTHCPSEFPQSGYNEEHPFNKPLQTKDTHPESLLPLILQAPAEIFHGSRNASPLAPEIYPTQDSPPSTPSSYTASPKTPARSSRSYTSSPKIADTGTKIMIGVKRPYDHISSIPSQDEPTYPTSTPEKIQKSRLAPLRHRPTPASVAASHKKLSTPFRSPMLVKSSISNIHAPSPSGLSKTPKFPDSKKNSPPHDALDPFSTHTDVKPNTSKTTKPEPKELQRLRHLPKEPISQISKSASKPFSSPLLKKHPSATDSSTESHSSGIEKRKIQSLEKKLHILRQAKKIRLARSTEILQADALKWKTAARQAAEELWSLVQSNTSGGMGGGIPNSSYTDHSNPSPGDSRRNNSFESSYGWATSDADERRDDVLAQLKGGGFDADWGWANPSSASSDDAERHGYHAEGSGGECSEQYAESTSQPPSPSSLVRQLYRPYRQGGQGASHHRKANKQMSVIPEDEGDGTEDVIGKEVRAASGECYSDQDEGKEPERVEYTLGAMLVSFGIDAKGTLGWDDAEGDFVDP